MNTEIREIISIYTKVISKKLINYFESYKEAILRVKLTKGN